MRRRLGLRAMVLPLFLMSLAVAHAEVITFDHNGNQAGFELIQQTARGVELKFRLEQVRFEEMTVDGTVYQQVSIPGVFLPVQAGAPNLPSLGRMLALPGGARADLEVIGVHRETIRGINVLPAAPIRLETDDSPPVYAQDPVIYSRDALWPEEMVRLTDRQKVRGVETVVLGILPFQYNPVRKELIVYSEIHIRIDFRGGNGKFGEDRLRSKDWDSILRQNLLTFDSLPALESIETTDGVTPEGEYEYVILTPDNPIYITQAERLRDFRVEQGISSGVVTLTETGATAAEIEEWIDDAYENWATPPEAVLLLADWTADGGGDGITSPEFGSHGVSDNIYADHDGDHLPDIVFARITATPENVERMVSKVIDYELLPPTDPDFYDHPLMACGWQLDSWFALCSEIGYGFLENVLGKHPVREYGNGTTDLDSWSSNVNTPMLVDYFGPDGLGYIPLTPEYLTDWSGDADGVNDAINSGAFMTHHRNHGATFGWQYPQYLTSDLDGLHNADLTYVFSINCSTGMFDYATEVFAEAFHRMENGALGIVAPSNLTYSFVNDVLVFGIWDYMWPEFDPGYGGPGPFDTRPAFALASAKYYLRDSAWVSLSDFYKEITYHVFHAHGDPYTVLYTEVPQDLAVEHDGVLHLYADSFRVKASPGATIALSYDGRVLCVVEASGDWQQMAVRPMLEEGQVNLTVTKQNHYRHSETIAVLPACTMSVSPAGIPVSQESEVQVTVWDASGQLASDMVVSIDGWGIEEVGGVTDVSGEVSLSVVPPYGEALLVRSGEPGQSYFCARADLPVEGGTDFDNATISAAVPSVGLEGMLTPNLEGMLTASSSENEFTLFANGCGVDASTASGPNSTAELLVLPVSTGLIETAIGKPGFNLFELQFMVEWVFGTVSGSVRNPEGETLEGVLVQFYAEGAIPGQDPPFVQATTDENGWYGSDESFPAGPWNAFLTVVFGYEDLSADIVVNVGSNTIDFTMEHLPSGLLSGTVSDAGSGEPVEGWVQIYRNDDQSFYTKVMTDPATGQYEVELPYFEYRIVAEGFHHFEAEAVLLIDQPLSPLDFSLDESLGGILVIDNFYPVPYTSTHSATIFEEDLWAMGYKPELEHETLTDPSSWWNYDVVVWSTDSSSIPLADAEDRLAVRNYLAGGGRLLLESSNVAADAENDGYEEWFFDEVLHADYISWSVGYLELIAGSHVLATTPNLLDDIDPANLSYHFNDDVVDPRSDAELVFGWSDHPGQGGVLVWDDDPDPDHGNLVYMSFEYQSADPVARPLLLENSIVYLNNRSGGGVGSGSIAGTALLDGESDHSGIIVETLPSSSTAVTAGDGSYALTSVLAGTYSVVATRDGWTDDQFDGVEVVADQTTPGIDFLLYPDSSNLPPEAENQQVSTKLNKSVTITLEASDPDGDLLTYTCVTFPANGTMSGCDDGDQYVTYSPNSQFTGNDSFTFKANDGELDSNEATVTVRVTKGGGGGGGGGKPIDGVVTLEQKPRELEN